MFVGFRDRELVRRAASEIAKRAGSRGFRIMHVCGTHEWSITHFGLREMLPANVKVVAGPGCPVCVTPGAEIDAVAELAARRKAVVTTFGDVLRVPGARSSLAEAKAAGGDVRVVYSVTDAVQMARAEPDKEFVHFSIGFETTAPMSAVELIKGPPKNFSIYSSHKLIPPAMEFLLGSGAGIDGFICPGHVSTIIGARAYEPIASKYGKPMVISGFEPLDVISGILNIVTQVVSGRAAVDNEYTRAVRVEGNEIAMGAISKVFEPCDSFWRGIGAIRGSGMRVRGVYREHDACARHGIEGGADEGMPEGCGCGDVLVGRMEPEGCPLFGKSCTPARPVGPCMVSSEGTCAIAFKYRKVR
uniref:Hydrogenase formation protein HypD n=1 Tax=Candidatus Methanomethylicus mesodigestus TaxID=1867258 RepID=A0A7C3J3Z5_9CREN